MGEIIGGAGPRASSTVVGMAERMIPCQLQGEDDARGWETSCAGASARRAGTLRPALPTIFAHKHSVNIAKRMLLP